jgi:2-polyprenyl-6-hydroxyphenyl methylase/3-demethylubiquinone-9 3-methyltransferase
MPSATRSTIDDAEVARFQALAATWWDEAGPMRMLHRLNPVRLGYIRDQCAEHFGCDPKKLGSLKGLRVLDIGCGAGILSEPLARLGADVTGADPAEENIALAREHAKAGGLSIDYRTDTAEVLADAGEKFDLVLAMEVVEHVADLELFVRRAAEMVKPGGLMIGATINRTFKSFGLAIVAAEYVLGWVPRGTHSWDKFVTPKEFETAMRGGALSVTHESGVIYNIVTGEWQLSRDMDVNYMLTAARAG